MPVEKTEEVQSHKPRRLKFRLPKSAAVVIILQPNAESLGITFFKMLAKVTEKVDLQIHGITALRFKKDVTGGRVLDVPGATSGEKGWLCDRGKINPYRYLSAAPVAAATSDFYRPP